MTVYTLTLAAALICSDPTAVDGDTFRCGAVHVRLWGVDAPEHYQPGGAASTAALAALLRSGVVTCQPKGRSYRRVVAMCWVDGRDVAGALVRGGWAADWPRYSHGYYTQDRTP